MTVSDDEESEVSGWAFEADVPETSSEEEAVLCAMPEVSEAEEEADEALPHAARDKPTDAASINVIIFGSSGIPVGKKCHFPL